MKLRLLTGLVAFITSTGWADPAVTKPGDLLWSNPLTNATDLANSEGAGTIVNDPERGAVLFMTQTNATWSAIRSFPLPAGRFRNRFGFVGADVKAEDISSKPQSWNDIKVMVRIETPRGSQWPQPEIPAGSFDWHRYSRRILVPTNATAVTLMLGLEHVSGKARFRDVRIVLAREVVEAPAAPGNAPIFRGHELPRLRGAMIAPDTLTENDLRVLATDWGGQIWCDGN